MPETGLLSPPREIKHTFSHEQDELRSECDNRTVLCPVTDFISRSALVTCKITRTVYERRVPAFDPSAILLIVHVKLHRRKDFYIIDF